MLQQKLNISTRQKLNQSAQQIQLMNFLKLNSIELEQKILDELSDNPALLSNSAEDESDLPAEDETDVHNSENTGAETETEVMEQYLQDETSDEYTIPESLSKQEQNTFDTQADTDKDFRENLLAQLDEMTLTASEITLCQFIIQNLSDDGYLRMTTEDLCDEISLAEQTFFTDEECENALDIVRSLDPSGIAADSLQTCLRLQLECLPANTPGIQIALTLVEQYLEEWANHKHENWPDKLGVCPEAFQQALKLIKKLNPFPVGKADSVLPQIFNIVPDYIIEKNDAGELVADLVRSDKLNVSINAELEARLADLKAQKDKSTKTQYLSSKMESALWFIDMIRQREYTMKRTIQAILNWQIEYFRTGDEQKLQPMILMDIAELTQLSVSTISRVSSGKYAMTDFGLIHLKDLFQKGIYKKNGEIVHVQEVQTLILELIKKEDPQYPLSDIDIVKKLESDGYRIARRTVSKYRADLRIAASKERQN